MSQVQAVLRAFPRIQFACRPREVRTPGDDDRVSAHQAKILSHLDDVDPTMVGELAEHLGVTASTMSLNLKRLESSGHVRRDPDPADRRVTNVRLTEAGVAVRDAREVLDPLRVDALLRMLEPADRRRAVDGLRLLAEAADALVRRGREDLETLTGGAGG